MGNITKYYLRQLLDPSEEDFANDEFDTIMFRLEFNNTVVVKTTSFSGQASLTTMTKDEARIYWGHLVDSGIYGVPSW